MRSGWSQGRWSACAPSWRQNRLLKTRQRWTACVALTERFCLEAGGKVRRHRQKNYGDLLEARFGPASRSLKPLLLLGHLDTVWPLGTLRTMPFSVRDGRVFGPGVFDMKAGVTMALTALEIWQARKLLKRPVILLLNSDEETGSEVSRPVTERLARASDAVFVLEPAQGPEGAYKTARKGVGEFRLHVRGVAAHSGVDFIRGHSAISELARLIGKVSEFTELKRGTTVNVGVIGGGTRSNVDCRRSVGRCGRANRPEAPTLPASKTIPFTASDR